MSLYRYTVIPLYRNLRLNVRMWVVTNEFEVLVMEVEDALDVRINLHRGQGARFARELQLGLFDVVQIKVRIACRVDKVTWFEACHLRHHLQQQRVRGNIKRHT